MSRFSKSAERRLKAPILRQVEHARLNDAERQIAEQHYSAQLTVAAHAYERQDLNTVEESLREFVPKMGQHDRRGFEGRHLWNVAQHRPHAQKALEGFHLPPVSSYIFSDKSPRSASCLRLSVYLVTSAETRLSSARTFDESSRTTISG